MPQTIFFTPPSSPLVFIFPDPLPLGQEQSIMTPPLTSMPTRNLNDSDVPGVQDNDSRAAPETSARFYTLSDTESDGDLTEGEVSDDEECNSSHCPYCDSDDSDNSDDDGAPISKGEVPANLISDSDIDCEEDQLSEDSYDNTPMLASQTWACLSNLGEDVSPSALPLLTFTSFYVEVEEAFCAITHQYNIGNYWQKDVVDSEEDFVYRYKMPGAWPPSYLL